MAWGCVSKQGQESGVQEKETEPNRAKSRRPPWTRPRSPPWVSCDDSQALDRESVTTPEEQSSLTLSIAPKMPGSVFLQNSPGHWGTLMAHRKWPGHHLFVGFLPKCLHKSFLLNKELISFLVFKSFLKTVFSRNHKRKCRDCLGPAVRSNMASKSSTLLWAVLSYPTLECLLSFYHPSRASRSSTASRTKEE